MSTILCLWNMLPLLWLSPATMAGVATAASHSALDVPANLAALAQPIWSSDQSAEYVLARSEFTVRKTIATAVAFVTAELSPFCQPDPRLIDNDYGSCLPVCVTQSASIDVLHWMQTTHLIRTASSSNVCSAAARHNRSYLAHTSCLSTAYSLGWDPAA